MKIGDLLSGHMLGDGGLWQRKEGHNVAFRIIRKSTDWDYLVWSSKILAKFLSKKPLHKSSYYDNRTKKSYYSIISR